VPAVLAQALSSLPRLREQWGWLDTLLSISPEASALLQGFLPTLVMPIFFLLAKVVLRSTRDLVIELVQNGFQLSFTLFFVLDGNAFTLLVDHCVC
jgi:hypothetical protein